MKLETLKDLDKLLLLCRKRGVRTCKIDNLEFHLEDLPEQAPKARRQVENVSGMTETLTATDNVTIPTDGWDSLTDDEKLFYSASGQTPGQQ